jgi:hypothetical protein
MNTNENKPGFSFVFIRGPMFSAGGASDSDAGGTSIGKVSGDRGFDSKANRDLIEGDGIDNAICPKTPSELKKRMKEPEFVELQQRRSQTEARIAIFKNGFVGAPLLNKGYSNQNRENTRITISQNIKLTTTDGWTSFPDTERLRDAANLRKVLLSARSFSRKIQGNGTSSI